VGVDGSASAWRALELAAGMARAFGAQITLVHAFAPVRESLGEPYGDDALGRRIAAGERLVQEAAEFIPDLAPECEVLQGPAGDAIVRVANVRQADLIVLGVHRQNAVRRLIGNVSSDVQHQAPCAVLLVRQEPTVPALTERIREA